MLGEKARALGWPPERIVIYEDAGRSAAFGTYREQFELLKTAIRTGQIGIVLVVDPSRCARNQADWGVLAELLKQSGTLFWSEDEIFDVRLPEDDARLFLSFGDHQEAYRDLVSNMNESSWALARKGKLKMRIPVGFAYAGDDIVFDDRPGVRTAIAEVFAEFAKRRSAFAVYAYYQQEGKLLPIKGKGSRGEIVWKPPTYKQLHCIIENVTYAGVYAYGRSKIKWEIDGRNIRKMKSIRVDSIEKSTVFLIGAFKGYISYQEYKKNVEILKENRFDKGKGVPRRGKALLQGLAWCGHCGHRLSVSYSREGRPVYACSYRRSRGGSVCQQMAGHVIEAVVLQAVSEALEPASVTLALRHYDAKRLEAQEQLANAQEQLCQAQAALHKACESVARAITHGSRQVVIDHMNRSVIEAEEVVEIAQVRLKAIQESSCLSTLSVPSAPLDVEALKRHLYDVPLQAKAVLHGMVDRVVVKRSGDRVLLVIHWPTQDITVFEFDVVRRHRAKSNMDVSRGGGQ